ncbi:ribonuclease Le37 [Ceratobasidium sp. AG-I]|nr:ribonuclease Le37 [Ceratobasidium sp. AG-I]
MFSTLAVLLGLPAVAVASSLVDLDAQSIFTYTSCPLSGSTSCQNTTAQANLCCFEAPGGQLLQTQFWDFDPSIGPSDSWTIHGLWPDHCDGNFDSSCDAARAYTDIESILTNGGAGDLLNYMRTYWKALNGDDEHLWEHEWSKHGTCLSTLEPACISSSIKGQDAIYYFTRVVNLFQNLTTYEFLGAAGIHPSSTATYTLSQITAAVKAKWGFIPAFDCKGKSLNAVSYYYNLKGSIIDGTFVPINAPKAGSCDRTKPLRYPLKNGSPAPTATTTGAATRTTTTVVSTSTSVPTKANIVAIISGAQNGCLLTAGKWSTQSCATYTIRTVSDGFTLTTSKGLCEVSGGTLSCGSHVTSGSVFTSTGGLLTYKGSIAFTSDSIPSGTTQVTVFTGSSHAQDITLSIVST